jgi:vacuolar-type H+-ATPase subunit D/Vma8
MRLETTIDQDQSHLDIEAHSVSETRGLTEEVDITKTAEEVIFTSNAKPETDNPKVFIHEEVIVQRKNTFPKHFINDGRQTIIDTEDEYYCHLTPITVRIQSSKATTYRLERVLYSILLALQHSDPTARLVVWDYDFDDDVSNLDQVRRCSDLSPSTMKKFIEEPTTNKSLSFSGRICLLSELTLLEMKQDEMVRAWLNKERVYLTENNLETATTAAVGIITGWIPRTMAAVHTARLRNTIAMAPGFLVEYKWLSEGQHIKAKFIMIRAAQRDVSQLVKVLTAQNGKSDFIFHPWDHIMSLSKNQKRHFIQSETVFQQKSYSLLIKNLRSGIDDVTMRYNETLDEKGKIVTAKQALTRQDKQQTVREFLSTHYKTWDGQQLFKTVHMEASGIIEVLVTEARFIEAKRCIEQIRQDMTCYMTAAASKASFDDYKLLQQRADCHFLWTAIDLSGYAESKNERRGSDVPKRPRIDTKAATYSNITKRSNTQSIANCFGGGRDTPVSSLATAAETATDRTPMMELQTQNEVLTTKVAELEGIVKTSHQAITESFDNLVKVMHQENTSRSTEIDDKIGELEKWVKQSQSITTSAMASLAQNVGTTEGVVEHLMTQTIPTLQKEVKNIKVSLESKMDDGFASIKNMFESMMHHNHSNSLYRAEGDLPPDVKHKRNRSGSRSRKVLVDNNQLDSKGRQQSGDSRENDKLDDLTRSDHQMSGTGDRP